MTKSESENDDIAVLRDAAAALSKLRDLDLEEMELASRFTAAANALEQGATVKDLPGKLHVARRVLSAHGGAK
jgi:hypothetical protein